MSTRLLRSPSWTDLSTHPSDLPLRGWVTGAFFDELNGVYDEGEAFSDVGVNLSGPVSPVSPGGPGGPGGPEGPGGPGGPEGPGGGDPGPK